MIKLTQFMKKKKFSLKVFLIAVVYIIVALGIIAYGRILTKSVIGFDLSFLLFLILLFVPLYYMDRNRRKK
jgi:hypothetical protein